MFTKLVTSFQVNFLWPCWLVCGAIYRLSVILHFLHKIDSTALCHTYFTAEEKRYFIIIVYYEQSQIFQGRKRWLFIAKSERPIKYVQHRDHPHTPSLIQRLFSLHCKNCYSCSVTLRSIRAYKLNSSWFKIEIVSACSRIITVNVGDSWSFWISTCDSLQKRITLLSLLCSLNINCSLMFILDHNNKWVCVTFKLHIWP